MRGAVVLSLSRDTLNNPSARLNFLCVELQSTDLFRPSLVMKLLRRAAHEAVRQLGINVPTAVMAILCIGLTIPIIAVFSGPEASDPETESVAGFILWLLKSLAWIGAWVAVFATLWVWNILKVAQREKAISEKLRMAANGAAWRDDQMKLFLCKSLKDPCYGVAKCYVFGSVVRRHPTRDVDIVVQFDSSKQGPVRTYRERLRNIESSFREFYGLKLHLQTFLFDEDDSLDRFLDHAGAYERIV